jgi:hypothetical protein
MASLVKVSGVVGRFARQTLTTTRTLVSTRILSWLSSFCLWLHLTLKFGDIPFNDISLDRSLRGIHVRA